jgi:hypothetical protein
MQHSAAERRFTLSDLVVLIAAAAFGFALLKPALSSLAARPIRLTGGAAEYAIFYGLLFGTPVLIASSLTLVALSLRPPRPPLRRLHRWPGFVVNASGILGVSVILVHYLGQTIIDPSRFSGTYMHVLSTGLPGDVGYFVLGSFLPLVLRGQWRPRPTWTDRLGWAIGVLWVAMALLTWSRLYLILMR